MTKPIPFGAAYPSTRKGTNFSQRFLIYAFRCGVIYEHGDAAFNLLALVSLTEGRRWYRGPVRFWRDHLLSILGIDRNRLSAITKSLVRDGWLHYEKGAKGRAAVYWVLVPGGDDEINDAPLGETDSDTDILHRKADRIPDSKRAESLTESVTHSKEYQEPKNPPPSAAGGEEEDGSNRKRSSGKASPSAEHLEAIAQVRSLGVTLAEETISEAVRLGASLEHVAAVLQHAAGFPVYRHPERGAVRPWGGGAVRTRLRNPSLLMLPPDQGWAEPNPDWKDLHRKALASARRTAESRNRAQEKAASEASSEVDRERLKQLEFDFGAAVDRLSRDELVDLLTARGGGAASPFYIKQVRKSGAKGAVRSVLLRAFAEKAGVN